MKPEQLSAMISTYPEVRRSVPIFAAPECLGRVCLIIWRQVNRFTNFWTVLGR